MDGYKLKMKEIGEHEFEADGPTEVVQAEFQAFRDLVLAVGRAATPAARGNRAGKETRSRQGPQPATNGRFPDA